jgi:5'-3' exoribonuclease 1
MGIKHFFIWMKKNHPLCLKDIHIDNEDFETENIEIDNLCIDMNGVFHYCAQKVYQYGNFARNKKLLRKQHTRNGLKWQLRFFHEICERIEFLRKIVKPKKRLILCVDGVAGMAKMSQQRQRRFKSAREPGGLEHTNFNPINITPGTELMDYLMKYIDWYIRMMVSQSPEWENLCVIFSSDKVPGEGEHKIINYMRRYGEDNESWCIHGLDADLIMLGLATMEPKFYILRENMYRRDEFHGLNIGKMRDELALRMKWDKTENSVSYNSKLAIYDFVFMCFLVGNDFLPTIPTLAILEGGIDTMLDVYSQTCQAYGHLTRIQRRRGFDPQVVIRPSSLQIFLGTLSGYEKGLLEEKQSQRGSFHEDKILNNHTTFIDDKCEIDFESYKLDFYRKKFGEKKVETVAQEYLQGMQWVLSYYTHGISSYSWYFKEFYAPFLCDLTLACAEYKGEKLPFGKPYPPFVQLLCVIPPKYSDILPKPLSDFMKDEKYNLKKYYPETFEIDVSGKRQEWEGIVVLPMVDVDKVIEKYEEHYPKVEDKYKRRNRFDTSYIYKYKTRGKKYLFKSFYGNIPECNVNKISFNL